MPSELIPDFTLANLVQDMRDEIRSHRSELRDARKAKEWAECIQAEARIDTLLFWVDWIENGGHE